MMGAGTLGVPADLGVVLMERSGVRVVSRGLGQTMTSEAGAGLGASDTAPNVLSIILMNRVRELKRRERPDARFYSPKLIPLVLNMLPSELAEIAKVNNISKEAVEVVAREIKTLARIMEVEAGDPYLDYIDILSNHDVIDQKDIELVRAFKEYAFETRKAVEEVVEIVTKSGKKLFMKVKNGKLVVYGDTFHVKEVLKSMGFGWDPLEKVWYATADINTVKARLEAV
jgi:hypothetical protein